MTATFSWRHTPRLDDLGHGGFEIGSRVDEMVDRGFKQGGSVDSRVLGTSAEIDNDQASSTGQRIISPDAGLAPVGKDETTTDTLHCAGHAIPETSQQGGTDVFGIDRNLLDASASGQSLGPVAYIA